MATPEDDDAIVAMSLALYEHDSPPPKVSRGQVQRTLDTLRAQPVRGRALVLDADGQPAGYALLVSFWSNELGGEICTIDELYVAPAWRSQGFGTRLIEAVGRGDLWETTPVALELEVAPHNSGAYALYTRLGFASKTNRTLRRMVSS